MKSPLFDFTLSELAALREKHPAGHFYYALKAALPEKGDAEKEEEKDLLPASLTEKCARFHEFLEKYRRLNAAVSPDRLILQLLTEYSLLPMLSAGLDGEETKKCRLAVMKYYDLARSYAERGRSGLSVFFSKWKNGGKAKAGKSRRRALFPERSV